MVSYLRSFGEGETLNRGTIVRELIRGVQFLRERCASFHPRMTSQFALQQSDRRKGREVNRGFQDF